MFQSRNKTIYMNSINNLRGTAGTNPQHNQHIQQIAQCIQDAMSGNNFEYDMELAEMRQTLQRLEERIAHLESIVQNPPKQTPPATPIPADIFITPTSLRKAKNDLKRYLN